MGYVKIKNNDVYTYGLYCQIHQKLGGKTIHYSSGMLAAFIYPLMSEEGFDEDLKELNDRNKLMRQPELKGFLSRLFNINLSHDTWAYLGLKSSLLLMERLHPFYGKY